MTVKNKVGISKLLYLTLFALIFLQLVNFCVFKYFAFTVNDQIVFGLLGNNFSAYLISLLIFVILIFFYLKKIFTLEIFFVLAGLLSNILDRLFYGGVIDYFLLFFIPKFNLADIFIVAGSALVTYKAIKS